MNAIVDTIDLIFDTLKEDLPFGRSSKCSLTNNIN